MLLPNTDTRHLAFKADVDALLRKHGASCSALELLALCSQIVGMLVAFQDQRTCTPEAVMRLVNGNIGIGNQIAIDGLLGETKGNA